MLGCNPCLVLAKTNLGETIRSWFVSAGDENLGKAYTSWVGKGWRHLSRAVSVVYWFDSSFVHLPCPGLLSCLLYSSLTPPAGGNFVIDFLLVLHCYHTPGCVGGGPRRGEAGEEHTPAAKSFDNCSFQQCSFL